MINIKNLSISYGKNLVLDNICWKIDKGDFWIILGSNGAGKSTLMQCLSRHVAVNDGVISVDDVDVNLFKSKTFARKVGYLPQRLVFHSPFTVRELLELSQYSTFLNKDKYNQTLQLFHLHGFEDQLVTNLSGGELQRLLLAAVYIQDTDYILLDEPFSFLDPLQSDLLIEIIEELYFNQKKTFVVVLHYLHNLYFSRVFKGAKGLFLKNSEVFFQGPLNKGVELFEEFFERKFQVFKKGNQKVYL